MDFKFIGKNIKRKRKELGLKQKEVADQINLSVVFISQIENGVRKPSLENLLKIANVLGVNIDLLITPVENNESQALIKEIVNVCDKRDTEQISLYLNIIKEIDKGIWLTHKSTIGPMKTGKTHLI